MTTELTAKPKTIGDLQLFVATRMKQIKSVIASNLTPEKMARIALNELRNSDYLARCAIQNPDSFINSIVQASHLGLEIGGALGQAYLVPFKGEIKMMPGYRGLISLARRSGEITSINAEIVYDQDEFDLSLGLEAKVTHKPKIRGERGEPVLVYMVAHFKSGGHHFEWMSIDEVLKIKDRSSAVVAAKKDNRKTPWDTDRDEMIRKTVIRRGWKYLPMSIEMQTAQVIEAANENGQSVTIDNSVIEGEVIVTTDKVEIEKEKTLPACSDDKFKEMCVDVTDQESGEIKKMGWRSLVQSGSKTSDELIAMLSTKYSFSDAQKETIISWGKK